MENKIMSHKTKGLLIALIIIVIGIAGYFGGFAYQNWFGWLSYCVLIIAVIWGCVYYAQQLDGRVSFGNIFVHGFKMSIVITLILLLYTVIAVTLLFPEMKEKGMEIARQRLEEQGKMTSEQIDQALGMVKNFFWPITIGTIILGNLIFGCIGSLIGAAVAKKKPINPLDQLPV
jgi:H+/Cl- antiporter ClcA